MNVAKYLKELQEESMQLYIKKTLENFRISKAKLVDMLLTERESTNSMTDAAEAVSTRLKYYMI